MAIDVLVPVDGVIVEVYVNTGDRVSKDTNLFMVEKAKTTMIVRSTVPGTISKLNVTPGDDVAANSVAATIDQSQD